MTERKGEKMEKRRNLWRYACLSIVGGSLALGLSSCGQGKPERVFEPSYFDLEEREYFPTRTNIPDNNRLSTQGVALGRYLFYDIRLTGRYQADSMLSCASCHVQEHSFESGLDNPLLVDGKMQGIRGMTTAHAMLPLINLAYNTRYFGWNGSREYPSANLEDLVKATLLDSTEFAGHADSIVKRIAAIPMYPPLFEDAFGSETVTFDRIASAIAQFIRTLVSGDSKFDRYLRGEAQLTAEELRGYVLFTTEEGADCFHCHGGSGNVLFTTYDILINGLDPETAFNDPYDRFSVTGATSDRGAYRVPSLRNIEYTAPYMHDGRFSTLDEVIDQYSENVYYSPYISPLMHHVNDGGVQLTPDEKACLKAFLLTLSDEEFIRNPNFSNPFVQDTIPESGTAVPEQE